MIQKITLNQVIFSKNYASDSIVVLMLSKSSNSKLVSASLDNSQYAFSMRLERMRDEREVRAWWDTLTDADAEGLNFHEFSVHDLTDGKHEGIKTKSNTAKVIRRCTPLSRKDVENNLRAQFADESKFEWADE